MELLHAFGIDSRLLIANLINFLLLVGILYKLGYKPILKFVKERQEKIAQGLLDAEKASKKLSEALDEQKALLSKTHKEAQEIIGKAREQAEIQAQGIIKKTNAQAKDIVERAKKEIRQQQTQSQLEVRREAASLVIGLTEKLLRKKVDAKTDHAFINDSLKELK
ncbi:ATP synthase F0 subunit B [bacterium CG10_46_32]|nr:MAG: ATP synthase F0 subunit B [bacterium CG10_46_32]PIR56580.1 MAG: ATP synthase F0 subunit B [Parcubacteria group bacterium CG10_big_fil_rev_8_21_14_0_10_46_32]